MYFSGFLFHFTTCRSVFGRQSALWALKYDRGAVCTIPKTLDYLAQVVVDNFCAVTEIQDTDFINILHNFPSEAGRLCKRLLQGL